MTKHKLPDTVVNEPADGNGVGVVAVQDVNALAIAACTCAVVAICVVFALPLAVGAAGVPVKVGLAASATVLPVPVVVAAMSWLLLLVARAAADAGTDAPLTFPTVVATDPALVVTSPVSAGISDALRYPPAPNCAAPLAAPKSLRSALTGCAAAGTPLVLMEVKYLCVAEARDSMPPSVDADGFGRYAPVSAVQVGAAIPLIAVIT